jgi:hypothetical protein
MFLTRTGAREQTLATTSTGSELMNLRDLSFSHETGLNFQLMRETSFGWDIAVDFSMVDWWHTSRSVTGTNMESSGAWGIHTYGGGAEIVASYGSSLYSTEINFRRQTPDPITPFVGFRWIELHEQFVIDMTQTTGIYEPGIVSATNADNHMYGFQIGADSLLLKRGRLEIETLVKAGIFGNSIDQVTYATNRGIGVTADASARTTHTTFAGDLQLTGEYQLTQCMAVRAGYQLLWLEGVALAPDQFRSTDLAAETASVDTTGSPFYHGAFVALEFMR